MISTLVYNQAQKTPLADGRVESSLKAPYFFTEALAEKIERLPDDQQVALRKELGMSDARTPTDRGLWLTWVDEAVWRLCFSHESLPELEKQRRLHPVGEQKIAPPKPVPKKGARSAKKPYQEQQRPSRQV